MQKRLPVEEATAPGVTVLHISMLNISRKSIATLLIGIAALFFISNILGLFVQHIGGVQSDLFLSAFQRIDLIEEFNLPSWFSSMLLLLCALVFAPTFLIVRQKVLPFATHWGVLALIFIYLSIDEMVRIHDLIPILLAPLFRGSSFTGYSWTLVAAPLVLAFTLAYLRLFLYLPRHIQRLFLLAGFLYVGGALGLEVVGWPVEMIFGFRSLPYDLLLIVEETCEMVGSIVLLYGAMSYVRSLGSTIRVALA